MPTDNATLQLRNILRCDKPYIPASLEPIFLKNKDNPARYAELINEAYLMSLNSLFSQNNKGSTFLIKLIKEAETSYHWNSIIEALRLIPQQRLYELIEECSMELNEPLLHYLIQNIKDCNEGHVDSQFIVDFLQSISEEKRLNIICKLDGHEEQSALHLALVLSHSLTPSILATMPIEHRILALECIHEGVPLIYEAISWMPPYVLRKIWTLLPSTERLNFIIKIVKSINLPFNDQFFMSLCTIMQKEELDLMENILSNDLNLNNSLNLQLLRNSAIQANKQKKSLLELVKLKEVITPDDITQFNRLLNNKCLLQLSFEHSSEEEWFGKFSSMMNLVENEETSTKLLTQHRIEVLTEDNSAMVPFTFSPLTYFILHRAPLASIKKLIDFIPLQQRLSIVKYGLPLKEALSSRQLDTFLLLLQSLPQKDRILAFDLNDNESLWSSIIDLELKGIDLFKPTWDLLPEEKRMNFLLNTFIDGLSLFTFAVTYPPFKNTLLNSLTSTEWQELTKHSDCPFIWQSKDASQHDKITVKQINESTHAFLGDSQFSNLSSVNHQNKFSDSAISIPFTDKQNVLYLLLKYAKIDSHLFDSSILKNISFVTHTCISEKEHEPHSIVLSKTNQIVMANRQSLGLVQNFLKNKLEQSMSLFVSICERNSDNWELVSHPQLPPNHLEFAVLTFRKEQTIVHITVECNSLGKTNNKIMAQLLTSTFENETVECEFKNIRTEKSADDLIYTFHHFLKLNLGKSYYLELNSELINAIRKDLVYMHQGLIPELIKPKALQPKTDPFFITDDNLFSDTSEDALDEGDLSNHSFDEEPINTAENPTNINSYNPSQQLNNDEESIPPFQTHSIQDKSNTNLDPATPIPTEIHDNPLERNAEPPSDPDSINPLKTKILPNLSLAQIDSFIAQLKIINNHATLLEKDNYPSRAILARTLTKTIGDGFENYRTGVLPQNAFRVLCQTSITEAQNSELKDHRGWKNIFFNLGLALAGLGIGYVIAGLIRLHKTEGKHFFFHCNTRSIDETEVLNTLVNNVAPLTIN